MQDRHREVLRLAIPAFASLVAEPLFLLTDSAIVGHLGATELAALGIASAVLFTVVGLAVFLAYGTTAATARKLGAGDLRGALTVGMDGLWLAVGLGTIVALALAAVAGPVVVGLGASATVAPHAVAYLHASLPGLPGMLLVLAATGVLRGLQDTRTPLAVAVVGFALNAVLNYLLVYPAGLGIAGSGIGTAVAQLAMGVVLGGAVVRVARREGAPLRPDWSGIVGNARMGVPLVVRSAAMRLTLLVTTSTAAAMGDPQLAAYQVVYTVWTFTTFALDALAIAAQALTGRDLGAGEIERVRSTTRLMVRWGIGFGVVLTVVLLAISPWLGHAFTGDADVRAAIAVALVPCAIGMPLSGYVFVLDGVLIGAGDGRYLGFASVVTSAAYLVFAAGLLIAHARGVGLADGTPGLVLLWVTFVVVWMGARGLTLWHRERGTTWLVTGA